jgi:hypothetical protein
MPVNKAFTTGTRLTGGTTRLLLELTLDELIGLPRRSYTSTVQEIRVSFAEEAGRLICQVLLDDARIFSGCQATDDFIAADQFPAQGQVELTRVERLEGGGDL